MVSPHCGQRGKAKYRARAAMGGEAVQSVTIKPPYVPPFHPIPKRQSCAHFVAQR